MYKLGQTIGRLPSPTTARFHSLLLCNLTLFCVDTPAVFAAVPDVCRRQVRCLSAVSWVRLVPSSPHSQTSRTEEIHHVMLVVHFQQNPLFVPSLSLQIMSAFPLHTCRHLSLFFVFPSLFIEWGEKAQHPACTFALCFLSAWRRTRVSDEGTNMARPRRINRLWHLQKLGQTSLWMPSEWFR